MDAERYKTLKKTLGAWGAWGSWALWDKDLNNTAFIDASYRKLKTDYVFVGLNASKNLAGEPAWTNYHLTHRGSSEKKLSRVFTGTKFEGSYMTDIMKGKDFTSTGSAAALEKWKNNEALRNESIKFLQKEFKALGKVKMVYFFGKAVCCLWHGIPELRSCPAKIITHFAAFGNAFEKNVYGELGIEKP
ncbi:MAG: hypothetical protein LBL44_09780 [Treponema sp.]|jgi:hypothetical protein|nr:hypothetical protein [Treponema sp.]